MTTVGRGPNPENVPSGETVALCGEKRRRADSNRCTRLCRPLPNHSATAPPRHRSDPSVTPPGPAPLYWRQSNTGGPNVHRRRSHYAHRRHPSAGLASLRRRTRAPIRGRPVLVKGPRPGPFLRSEHGERDRGRALPALQRGDGVAPRHLAVSTLSPEARLLRGRTSELRRRSGARVATRGRSRAGARA